MIILMDIGNTRLKYCLYTDNKEAIYSDICWLENKALSIDWLNNNIGKAEQIILANVHHHQLTDLVKTWSEQSQIKFTHVVTEADSFGIKNGYEKPTQLGVDRWLAVLGTAKLFPDKNCLIIDTGTATTIDLLSAAGKHLGGWIAPGVNTMFSSVINNTSQVKAEQTDFSQLAFGLNSSDNLTHGSWAATAGLIEQAIKLAQEQLSALDIIVLTGGNAKKLAKMLNLEDKVVEHLIFHGLTRFIQ